MVIALTILSQSKCSLGHDGLYNFIHQAAQLSDAAHLPVNLPSHSVHQHQHSRIGVEVVQTKIGLFIYLILMSFNNIMIRGVTQPNYIQQILRVLSLFVLATTGTASFY